VVGSSGSGKSTLASRLAGLIGAEHIELDELFHQPNWTPLPDEEFRSRLAGAIVGDRWVVDGNYGAVRGIVWGAADTIVWIDLPRRVVMARLLRRTIGRVVFRKKLWNGNRESLRNAISTDPDRSVLVWAWTHFDERRATYSEAMVDKQSSHVDWVVLRSRREVRRFLDDQR